MNSAKAVTRADVPGGLGVCTVQPEPFIESPEPERRLCNLLQVSGFGRAAGDHPRPIGPNTRMTATRNRRKVH